MGDEKSLGAAVKGSYAVFGVTNFWESMDKDLEIKQGKNLSDAAKTAGVELFIWSSLPYVAKSEFVCVSLGFSPIMQRYPNNLG